MFSFPFSLSWAVATTLDAEAVRAEERLKSLRNLAVAKTQEQAALSDMLMAKQLLAKRQELQQP
jgi:hypothetical protein